MAKQSDFIQCYLYFGERSLDLPKGSQVYLVV